MVSLHMMRNMKMAVLGSGLTCIAVCDQAHNQKEPFTRLRCTAANEVQLSSATLCACWLPELRSCVVMPQGSLDDKS